MNIPRIMLIWRKYRIYAKYLIQENLEILPILFCRTLSTFLILPPKIFRARRATNPQTADPLRKSEDIVYVCTMAHIVKPEFYLFPFKPSPVFR